MISGPRSRQSAFVTVCDTCENVHLAHVYLIDKVVES